MSSEIQELTRLLQETLLPELRKVTAQLSLLTTAQAKAEEKFQGHKDRTAEKFQDIAARCTNRTIRLDDHDKRLQVLEARAQRGLELDQECKSKNQTAIDAFTLARKNYEKNEEQELRYRGFVRLVFKMVSGLSIVVIGAFILAH